MSANSMTACNVYSTTFFLLIMDYTMVGEPDVQYSTWMLHNRFTGKDDQKKCFWKDIHFALWIDVVWTRWSSIFQNHPVLVLLFILIFKSSWRYIPKAMSTNSSDDLCICFCKILILCEKFIAAHEQYGLGYTMDRVFD